MNRFFALAAATLSLAVLAPFAAGCSSADQDAASEDDNAITRDTHKDDVYIYNGLLPHLSNVHIVASLKGSTARVTGDAPDGWDGELPFYASATADGTTGKTLITVVYPIATAHIGGTNPNGSPIENRPGHYPNLIVSPFKTEGSPSEWGGFPYMEYNHDHQDAFHGPISFPVAEEWRLSRGPVSHGCSRMQGEHAVELANLIGINMLTNHKASESVTVNLSVDVINDYDKTPDGKFVNVNYPTTGNVVLPPAAQSKTWPTWSADDYPRVVCAMKAGRALDEHHCEYLAAGTKKDIVTQAQADAANASDDDAGTPVSDSDSGT